MKVTVRGTRKHGKYQLHISTWQVPSFFEKWFMGRSAGVVNYVGKGTKWYIMQMGDVNPLDYTTVTDKTIIKFLQSIHP